LKGLAARGRMLAPSIDVIRFRITLRAESGAVFSTELLGEPNKF